jgi:hypothetical protein
MPNGYSTLMSRHGDTAASRSYIEMAKSFRRITTPNGSDERILKPFRGQPNKALQRTGLRPAVAELGRWEAYRQMQQGQFSPGDRVVELAALAHTAAVVAGALTAVTNTWLGHRPWPVSLLALAGGGFAGFVVGLVVGRLLYRTADGRTAVVRVGRGALPAALRAALAGSLTSATAAAGLAVWLLAAPSLPSLLAAACCGLLTSLVLSCLASLI